MGVKELMATTVAAAEEEEEEEDDENGEEGDPPVVEVSLEGVEGDESSADGEWSEEES